LTNIKFCNLGSVKEYEVKGKSNTEFPACSCWIPCNKNLVEGKRERLLYRMATLDNKAGQKVLTTSADIVKSLKYKSARLDILFLRLLPRFVGPNSEALKNHYKWSPGHGETRCQVHSEAIIPEKQEVPKDKDISAIGIAVLIIFDLVILQLQSKKLIYIGLLQALPCVVNMPPFSHSQPWCYLQPLV
jgi:hypothetical protein